MGETAMITVTFKVDDYLYEKLTAFTITSKTTRSRVIRSALREVIKKGKVTGEDITGKPRIPVTFKLDQKVLAELDRIAIKYRLSRAQLIRIALIQYLKEHETPVQQAKVETLGKIF